MSWGNIIAGAIVLLMIAGAVAAVIKQKKRGGCPGCDGNCQHKDRDCPGK